MKTSGEVYKKTKPAARKKAKKSKLWTKYKGFIGSKLTSVQKLLLTVKITELQEHRKRHYQNPVV